MLENWSFLADHLPVYALRLGVATLCGILLGMEREWKDKPAGLRTIMLITLGAALYMIVSNLIPILTGAPEDITRADPTRVAAQVVSGIGFLGAGTIIQARGSVQGLTTAAVIWVSAGIGLCVGIGFPILGLAITVAVLLVLIIMDPVRHWLGRHGKERELDLLAPNDRFTLERIRHALEQHGVPTRKMSIHPHTKDTVRMHVSYRSSGSSTLRLLSALEQIDGVRGTPEFDEGVSSP